jgi:hypothetical protein
MNPQSQATDREVGITKLFKLSKIHIPVAQRKFEVILTFY